MLVLVLEVAPLLSPPRARGLSAWVAQSPTVELVACLHVTVESLTFLGGISATAERRLTWCGASSELTRKVSAI